MNEIVEAFDRYCNWVQWVELWHSTSAENRHEWEPGLSGWVGQIAEIELDPEIVSRFVESSPSDNARIGWRNSSGTILATVVEFVEHIQKLVCCGRQLEAVWSQMEGEKIIWFVTESGEVDWWKSRLVETTENRHSDDFATIVWDGRVYKFTEIQSVVVAELWKAYAKGTPDVGQHHLLEVANELTSKDKPPISKIFQRNPAWTKKLVIKKGERGNTYRLFSENF